MQRRLNISALVILLYSVSIVLLTIIPRSSWITITSGLILATCGSIFTFLLLRQWEQSLRLHFQKTTSATHNPRLRQTPRSDPFQSKENFLEIDKALSETQEEYKQLITEQNQKNEKLHKLEKEKDQFEQRIEDIHHELDTYKLNSEEELKRKTVLLTEYQETINQQREVIQKRQEQISELESKVRDLNYEVKTLLQLAEIGSQSSISSSEGMIVSESTQGYQVTTSKEEINSSSSNYQVKTSEEASQLLRRCIDIAQKITGANHFGNGNSRFRDMPIDNFALDLRRLFDSLRSEITSTVLVFSQKENKLLFTNEQTKSLLGWSSEKFIQNFQEIVQEGAIEWKKGIGQLSKDPESTVRLLMKTKSGQNLLVHCHLGVIPTGIFRNHVIGVLHPA